MLLRGQHNVPLCGKIKSQLAKPSSIYIDSFVLAEPSISLARSIRKENAEQAETTRQLIMYQLVNKIDILVMLFETRNTMLYGTYLSARALDITGTHNEPAQNEPVL